ncbi:MAG: VCBS repeat-containing protein [Planctomycetota bacterium]
MTLRRLRSFRDRFAPTALACAMTLGLAASADGQQFVHETSARFPTPFNEYSNQVAIEDIDGDGDLDLAFANGSGFFSAQQQQTLRIYINDGTGVFTDQSAARTGGHFSYARDVEFGDVDNDGDFDMVVANDFNSLANLFINDGNGFFTNESSTRLPQISLSSSHASFGDVDNDGDLDLWLTKGGSTRFGSGQPQLWLNDGSGFYTNATTTLLPQQTINSPMDSIFGDIDGDFDLDMMQGHRDTRSRLFRNDGTGAFTNITTTNLPTDSNTYSWDFGDLDGDGDLDLLGANSLNGSSREALWVNDGTGDFSNLTSSLISSASNPSVDDNDSKFFDVDNDGDLDFIIASLGSTERICLYNGTIFSWSTSLITSVGDSSLDVEVGDLDGNGTLDVVTAQGESGLFTNRVYMNNGPADTIPPIFPHFEQLDDTEDETGPYVARVIIRDGMTSDHNFFMQSRALIITVDGGTPFEVPLVWSGGDVYRAEIPGQPGGATVEYQATATDFAGNTGTSETLSFVVIDLEEFDRGDCNTDGAFDIADAISLLGVLFTSGGSFDCDDACDANDDGELDIADAVAALSSLFSGAGPLAAPHMSCGVDPTDDALDCPVSSCP